MFYTIFITPSAEKDLRAAVYYYNQNSEGLGFRFAKLAEEYFIRIALVPKASAIRYKNIRCKPMKTFPYLIMYTIDEKISTINILRIFNTRQKPLW